MNDAHLFFLMGALFCGPFWMWLAVILWTWSRR